VEELQTEVAFLFKRADLIEIFFGGEEKCDAIALQSGEGRV
jgi:hypothetical protein